MSSLTTSATRRSRIVPDAVLIASAAASSHEVPLVPMISVTLYTLMTLSFEACLPGRRDAQLFHIRLTPARAGPDRQCDVRQRIRAWHLAWATSSSLGDVQNRSRQIRDRAVHVLAGEVPREDSPGNPSCLPDHRRSRR